MSQFPTLDDLPSFEGRRVLMRVDFNVPLDGDRITDETRIREALPTITEVLKKGGKPILLSHLGRPKGEVKNELRLAPVAKKLEELTGARVHALRESIGSEVAAACAAAEAGSIVLLENVRFHAGETKGDPELAKSFAELGDVFVNDAFGTSHRDHSSVCGVARLLPSVAGRLLERELAAFQRVLHEPARPLVAILGGAKVSDKLPVIDSLIDRVQSILVGGGMAYTFLAARGISVGTSIVQEDQLDLVRAAEEKAKAKGVELLLPTDHVTADRFAEDAQPNVTPGVEIGEGQMALDIGPKTRANYAERIRGAKTVVWNGPMGVFEFESFRAGTEEVARAVAETSAWTVVGGGDSVAAVHLLSLADRIDHVSTGGGASLELLEKGTLPGIEALSV